MPFPSTADIAGALHGLSRVLRFDKEGFDYFDASAEGLLKSFWVAVVVLPLLLIDVGLDLSGMTSDTEVVSHPVRHVMVQVIGYVIDWVAFPLVILMLGDSLGFGGRAFHFLVSFNWFQLVAWPVLILLSVAARLTLLPVEPAVLLQVTAIVATLVYMAYLAREGLRVSWWSAVGVTVLSLTISLFIQMFAPWS